MKALLINLMLIFLLASCSSSNVDKEDEAYKNHKESVEEKERNSPLKFLSVSGVDKKNLIGQTVVHCVIRNTATMVSYKDVRIKMLCYGNATMVQEHEDVVSKPVDANSTINFKIRYRLPKGTDSIALSVMSAAALDKP